MEFNFIVEMMLRIYHLYNLKENLIINIELIVLLRGSFVVNR